MHFQSHALFSIIFLSSVVFCKPDDIVQRAYGYLSQHECRGTKWGTHFQFYRPSLTKYSADQWLWDSSAHMIVWSHRNATNSLLDLRSMLSQQQPDGRIPEIIFWSAAPETPLQRFLKHAWFSNPRATDLTQMPVVAFALRAIIQQSSTLSRAEEYSLVLSVVRYYEWWYKNRVLDDTGLVWIIHPWESGLDASPAYDEALGFPAGSKINNLYYYSKFIQLLLSYKFRYGWNQTLITHRPRPSPLPPTNYFLVADVGLNSVYAASWAILSSLATRHNSTLAAHCQSRFVTSRGAILHHMWSAERGMFVSLYKDRTGQNRQAAAETAQALFPLLLPGLSKELAAAVVQGQVLNASRFWSRYPIPSCSMADPRYQPVATRLMWRGPVWGMVNWLVMEGLVLQGFREPAEQLLDRWIELYEQHGIWEQYNPETGEPYGPEGLGMSTLIVDWMYRLGRVGGAATSSTARPPAT